jgi:hypothetical protein
LLEIMALEERDQLTVLRAMARVREEWEASATPEQVAWRDRQEFPGLDLTNGLAALARDRQLRRGMYDPSVRQRLVNKTPLAQMPEDFEPAASVEEVDFRGR